MYTRILVATDGSPLSEKAVAHALDLAKMCGSQLVALKVVPRYPRSYMEGGNAIGATDIKHIEAQWVEQAQAVLNTIKATGKAAGVSVKTSVAKSDLVAETIMAAADKQQADLIVMASHGRKGVQRLLLGSETQHVLTHSKVPVLILR